MLGETVYAYGTTIRVWYRKTYHTRIKKNNTRMVRTVRIRYVPYAYGMKYAYGTQQYHTSMVCKIVPYAYGTYVPYAYGIKYAYGTEQSRNHFSDIYAY